MLKFGFELEGFLRKKCSDDEPLEVKLPDTTKYPVDGFPGLIEARTVGGDTFDKAVASLWSEVKHITELVNKYDDDYVFDANLCEWKFTPKEKLKLRESDVSKYACKLRNIYSKDPKDLKGKTIASFQINISNVLREPYSITESPNKTTHVSASYGLFDMARVVLNLDKAFEKEIRDSGRTPGWYAIKDNGARLEYRSLPNFVADSLLHRYDHDNVKDRILEAIKGVV